MNVDGLADRNCWSRCIAAIAIFFSLFADGRGLQRQPKKQPHIVIIIADDLVSVDWNIIARYFYIIFLIYILKDGIGC